MRIETITTATFELNKISLVQHFSATSAVQLLALSLRRLSHSSHERPLTEGPFDIVATLLPLCSPAWLESRLSADTRGIRCVRRARAAANLWRRRLLQALPPLRGLLPQGRALSHLRPCHLHTHLPQRDRHRQLHESSHPVRGDGGGQLQRLVSLVTLRPGRRHRPRAALLRLEWHTAAWVRLGGLVRSRQGAEVRVGHCQHLVQERGGDKVGTQGHDCSGKQDCTLSTGNVHVQHNLRETLQLYKLYSRIL